MSASTHPLVSIWQSPERAWDELANGARWADERGWYCWWFADHFMPNTGDEKVIGGPVHECWSVIAAAAAVTNRIRLGSLVSPTTFRHPAVLANIAATIDNISRGRLTLGLGAGWQINEHLAYGVDLMAPRDRVDRFEEAIRIVSSLLTTSRTTMIGRHFTIRDAPCEPRPVQTPLPIMVGTGGPRMSRITVEHAHQWNTWGSVAEARRRIEVFDRACEDSGREPRSFHRSVQALFFPLTDSAKEAMIRTNAPADRAVVGAADEIVEAILAFSDMGFDEVIIPDFTLGRDASERAATYEWFDNLVIPALRDGTATRD